MLAGPCLVPLLLLLLQGCTSASARAKTRDAGQCEDKRVSEYKKFFSLLDDVIASQKDRHASRDMLPVCTHLSTQRPQFPHGEPQKWQRVKHKSLYVYSAFYERRPEADGPAIRVVGAALQARFNRVGSYYCQMWYQSMKHPLAVGPAIFNVIYPSRLHGDEWTAHFVLCPLPESLNEVPYAVSVTGIRCEEPSNHLMILNRDNYKKTNTHALCISPMYNRFNAWELLIEQIELQSLLGAAEVTLYDLSVSEQMRNVLDNYLSDKTINVNVIKWPFPPLRSNVWCQHCAINDCLYRMGHKHKYVTSNDMDEILVPRVVKTWPQLIGRIHSTYPDTGAFLFQHAYFRRNVTTEHPPLVTQSSFWRTDQVTPPGKIRCKSMYEADKAISIDLHFPYLLVPGAKELILDPKDGMLHHYRPYPMETFAKHPERYTFIEDRYMETYKKFVTAMVKRRYYFLGKHKKDT